MILHLERKFTSPTETFIVNQINALKSFEHMVFTMEFLMTLECVATVIAPEIKRMMDTYLMRKSQRDFFLDHLRKNKIEIIHAHYITDALVFRKLTQSVNVPKICSCYGYDVSVIPVKFKWLYKTYYKRIFDEYDVFLAMTEEMKKDLLEIGCPKKKIKVHYHGIDTKSFDFPRNYRLESRTIHLLTIASLYEVKGHMSVLKALVDLQKKHPEVLFKYTIVGEGPESEKLKSFVMKNNLVKNVSFIGAVRHGGKFNAYLQQADIFVHPSITTKQNDKEGIPGAIVEAMSSGLPVIATWHGGIPSVIKNEETGFLVKESDHEAIVEKICLLHKNETVRRKVGLAAKTYAIENLDVHKKAHDLQKMYRALIAKKNPN